MFCKRKSDLIHSYSYPQICTLLVLGLKACTIMTCSRVTILVMTVKGKGENSMKQRENRQKFRNYHSNFNIYVFIPLFLDRNDILYTFYISQGHSQVITYVFKK